MFFALIPRGEKSFLAIFYSLCSPQNITQYCSIYSQITKNKLKFKGHKGPKRPGFRPLRPCRWVLFLILHIVDMVDSADSLHIVDSADSVDSAKKSDSYAQKI